MTNEDVKELQVKQAAAQKRFAGLKAAFEAAIIDKLSEAIGPGGTYVPSTDALKGAAFAAMNEVIESEVEPVKPMLAVVLWESVVKINESAHRKGLERMEKAGTLPFKIATLKTTTVNALTAEYIS